jgi:polyisoprenyl-phosphate glycosyltransferase
MQLISIVIPAYNEEACIEAVVSEITAQFAELNYEFELIFVDDGSSDNTFGVIKKCALQDARVKGVRLSRNMGHQAALDCGLNHASGDAVISMDADLQHPPQLIPQMIKAWENGYDIVNTSKQTNEHAGFIYKLWAGFFYFVFNKFSQIKLTPSGSDFRLMSRRSLKALLSMPEYHKFYRGMVHFVGFKSTHIDFEVRDRFAGSRKYSFRKSLKLASDGLFSFSDFALKLPFMLGMVVLAIILVYLAFVGVEFLLGATTFEKGWTSLMVLIVLSLALQLIFMGILGIYISKIFFEVKKRPVYFTEEMTSNIHSESKLK